MGTISLGIADLRARENESPSRSFISWAFFLIADFAITDFADFFDFTDLVTADFADEDFVDEDFFEEDFLFEIQTDGDADFFDAAKFPTMHFKSTSLEKAGPNTYKLNGDLTLHGITKPVTMDLEYKGTVENPMSKKQTAGFQVSGIIKRSDFNLGGGFPEPMISNDVRIKADGEFIQ